MFSWVIKKLGSLLKISSNKNSHNTKTNQVNDSTINTARDLHIGNTYNIINKDNTLEKSSISQFKVTNNINNNFAINVENTEFFKKNILKRFYSANEAYLRIQSEKDIADELVKDGFLEKHSKKTMNASGDMGELYKLTLKGRSYITESHKSN